MISAPRLAWLQLLREKGRLVIALAGVGFAVLLVFMQLGFQNALFRSGVILHERLNGELVMITRDYTIVPRPRTFARARLFQALGFEGVDWVAGIDTAAVLFKNPETGQNRELFILAVDPSHEVLTLPEIEAARHLLRQPDVLLFDEATRPEFGPVAARFQHDGIVRTEVNHREVAVRAIFRLGNSFGIDGTIITSNETMRLLFPGRPDGVINIGVIHLKPGVDPEPVRAAMDAALARDVIVLTRQQYIDRETDFWARSTPIGFVFGFGVVMGLVVGAVVVYQILFADISDHLPEFATLKAMGYTNRFLSTVVLVQAFWLAVLGFVPGLAISWWLYDLTRQATALPMAVELRTMLVTLVLTVAMCWGAALVAIRKLRSADPAEIF